MNQKPLFLAVVLTALLVIGGVFWVMQKQVSQNSFQEEMADKKAEATPQFVTNVDPDVGHWQTKETGFFTIKFPKEWYWIEVPGEKPEFHGAHAISNNPHFPLEKNTELGIFSGIGPTPPIVLENNTEIVITDRGVPTSNAGTPSDALDSIFKLAKYNYPAANCVPPDNLKTLPTIAYCSAHYPEDQTQLSYYVIDNNWALTITARTRSDSDALQPIVEKIARSIQIKN